MSDHDFSRLPNELQRLVYEDNEGGNFMLLRDWAYAELKVPDYHAFRVHVNAARALCRLLNNPPTLLFRARAKADVLTGKRPWREYRCSELTEEGRTVQ